MKRCIFYLPYELDPAAARARMVRPRKMIQAFRDIGYDVFEIIGYARARKEKIAEVKRLVSSGVRFDFCYSEAATIPTLLTEPNHLPTHPFLDFGFFRYLKQHDIPIGLFYPDIYWKFDKYGKGMPAWKRMIALRNYQLDLHKYEQYLTCFYVPTRELCESLHSPRLLDISKELPPGADNLAVAERSYAERDFTVQPLTVFYVGGLGEYYQIGELLAAVSQTPHTRMILCCREKEWRAEKPKLEELLSDRIEIIHKSGAELEPYYAQADLCSLLFLKNPYRNMAKPVKAYEYLAYELPVLATEGMGIGDYVEETGIGWTMEFTREAIGRQLCAIMDDPAQLELKQKQCRKTKQKNTWMARADQVVDDLTVKG